MPPCQGGEGGSIPPGRTLTSIVKNAILESMTNAAKTANIIIALVGMFAIPFAVLAAVPTVTTNPASNVTSTEARLNGYITASGIKPLVVWAELGESSNSFYFSTPQDNYGAYTAVTYWEKVIELQPNTVYYFRVVAQNPEGKTYGSTLSFKTGSNGGAGISYSNPVNSGSTPTSNSAGAQAPSVTTMFATSVTYNSLTFNGYVSPQGSNTYRWFEWGNTQLFGNQSGYAFAGTQPNNFAFTATGLNPGTTYYFRAIAQNNAGVVQGSMFSATTLATNQSPVGTSSIVIAPLVSAKLPVGITTTQATLNALAIPGSASLVAGYFEWGNNQNSLTNGTPPQQLQSSGVTTLTHTVNGLFSATTYYYRAVVQDANLTTYRSAVVGFNTLSHTGGSGGQSSPTPQSYATGQAASQLGGPRQQQGSLAGWQATQKEPEETEQQNGRGAAGAIFFGTPAAGLVGWLLVIVLLMISVILGLMLRKCKKNQRIPNEANGFREFPE